MTQTAAPATFPCPHCGSAIVPGDLVCTNCNTLVYAQRLNEIAAEATQYEQQGNNIHAAMLWQQALPLLPNNSPQYSAVAQHIGALTAGITAAGGVANQQLNYQQRPQIHNDSLPLALAKTVGSMILSIIVYAWMFSTPYGLTFGAEFATGFVILILIHELGHVAAMRYYKLSASPPIFIPFLGALINLRQNPRNALEEAVVGIGGPVTGTIAATITFIIALKTNSPLMAELAEFGFLLNLFNLLPVPPLDGGRVTAAVSPWIWIPGLGLVVARIITGYFHGGHVNPIFILLLFYAWPRIKRTLSERHRDQPYYQIGWKATWGMGIAYVLLGSYLGVMYYLPSILALLERYGYIQYQ